MEEVYTECVKSPKNIRLKLRGVARGLYLSSAGSLPRKSTLKNSLHSITGHYVFDDQRKDFERQLEMLGNLGQFVSTKDAVDMIKGAVPIDGRYFHISFDDGLECVYRNAAPILDAAEIPALVFINSALAGEATKAEREDWEKATNYALPLRVMNWVQLNDSGFEIGAHTRTHRRLSQISGDAELLKSEILGCKAEIEEGLGKSCDYFAWPFGQQSDIDKVSMDMIRSAGYKACFGVGREPIKPGVTDIFNIPREHFEPQWPISHLKYFLA